MMPLLRAELLCFCFVFFSTSLPSFSVILDFCKPKVMDSDSQAASERILLEPYKYLLQLPGESFFMSVTECERYCTHAAVFLFLKSPIER